MSIALVYHNDPNSNSYLDMRFSVFSMAHAGQGSHCFAISDGRNLHLRRGKGIVDITDPPEKIPGPISIGRNSSKSGVKQATGFCDNYGEFGIAFDGYFLNGDDLREKRGGRTDADLVARYIAVAKDFEKGLENLENDIKGHFCVTMVTERGEAFAARSRLGVRSMIYGKGDNGQAIVSESRALENIDMDIIRDIRAGEKVSIDGSGIHTLNPSYEFGEDMRVCSFIFPYYNAIDGKTEGIPVARVKRRIGEHMAKNDKRDGIKVNVAAPVPDSGKGYPEGYAGEYGCPYSEILIKDPYAGRSYDQPEQTLRDTIAGIKLSAIPDRARVRTRIDWSQPQYVNILLEGLHKYISGVDGGITPENIEGHKQYLMKALSDAMGSQQADFFEDAIAALLEDSIRRGTQLIRPKGPIDKMKKAGVKEIHVRVCSPRNIMYCRCSPPDEDGYKDEKLAANRFPDDEEMANYLDSEGAVKTVRFIELDPFVDCVIEGSELTRDKLCLGCYTGDLGFLE